MLDTFINMFKVPELRKRLGFTVLMILIYRVGAHIPTPGIDIQALSNVFEQARQGGAGGLLDMYDMFVGGAFEKATIFALGVMPYISASIIVQLLGTVFPYFHKLQKEGAEGKKKITQITRYLTLVIALVQAVGASLFLAGRPGGHDIVMGSLSGLQFVLLTTLSLTTGTLFVMWLGERITNSGIGNGISLMILIGIIATMPHATINVLSDVQSGTMHVFRAGLILAIILALTAFIVFVHQATRRIPIQSPKRSVGGGVTGGQNTVLPLRLNMAGVIPIIFASSVMMLPGFVFGVFQNNEGFLGNVVNTLSPYFQMGGFYYSLFFALIIIFFTYFYTAIIFNPVDIAENLKRSGGFIPGIKPGYDTSQYLSGVLNRITLPGSVFLAFVAIVPFMLRGAMGVQFYLGGTSILIVVGVAIDTLQQIESKLHARNYSGFMKKGSLKGRISNG
ncbi:preprotein translocase subunit SecY [Chitinivibrio alkaliphilus]|uniref:Protein translocase subunit SecY n=1 Tax=Chitinivibrio alkaliphilus ACht1 TaxID=1313304 RepID=U7D5R1_9BACT|nr:preprotein translocase subunit SecY [Chitinivibrio alkaliphilus]ERP31308.1 Preprotein translocase subunit secY [Chitinivibrio alkaliphilus ACht1]